MKFSTAEEIGAPADRVFDAVSDFAYFEREAAGRGVEVSRVDRLEGELIGTTWSLRFALRGKMRRLVCDLRSLERPNGLLLRGESPLLELTLAVGLVPVTPLRTRLGIDLELRPRSIAGRLMLETVRLNRASYRRQFENRVRKYVTALEQREPCGG